MGEKQDRLWRTERAERFSVVVDAERYFEVAREALLQARSRIMLVGWDFDARIRHARNMLRGQVQVSTFEGREIIYLAIQKTTPMKRPPRAPARVPSLLIAPFVPFGTV